MFFMLPGFLDSFVTSHRLAEMIRMSDKNAVRFSCSSINLPIGLSELKSANNPARYVTNTIVTKTPKIKVIYNPFLIRKLQSID